MQLVTQGTKSVSKNYSLHCLFFFPCIMLKKITQPCLILLALGHFTLLTGSPTRTIEQKMCLSVVKPVSCVLGERKKKKRKVHVIMGSMKHQQINPIYIVIHLISSLVLSDPFLNHSSNIKDIKLPLPGKIVTEG